MKNSPVTPADLRGVMAVPPLARNGMGLSWDENDKIAKHLSNGGVTSLLYGGNAFLYHVTLAEYEELLAWMHQTPDSLWCIPSVGPSFGRMVDQIATLRKYPVPAAMHLPCSDPRDAAGLERGLRSFVEASGTPLILYLKDELNFGADKLAGLDVISRMVDDGMCIGVKYAVVRENPAEDWYLSALLERVDKQFVISGIGERPAIVHLKEFGLPGYTTGSGVIGARQTRELYHACRAGSWELAVEIRKAFIPLEDVRDKLGPARVLHAAVEVAGIATTGDIPPFISSLTAGERSLLPEALAPLSTPVVQGHTAR